MDIEEENADTTEVVEEAIGRKTGMAITSVGRSKTLIDGEMQTVGSAETDEEAEEEAQEEDAEEEDLEEDEEVEEEEEKEEEEKEKELVECVFSFWGPKYFTSLSCFDILTSWRRGECTAWRSNNCRRDRLTERRAHRLA